MPSVTLNGKVEEIDSTMTPEMLLSRLHLTSGSVVVEVNRQVVPRDEFSSHLIQDGDVVEIVQFVGGG